MEEQDKKIAEQLVESRIITQANADLALQEVDELQKKGNRLTLEDHLKAKKLLPDEFIVFPVIENITQMEVMDKHPPHQQFSGIRKDKTLWIFTADMTPQEYELVRNRIHLIRECPSNFLIHSKGFGTLYPWKGYVIRYIPQGLSLNKFLAQEPEPDPEEIQSVANFLLQGMAELESHFLPMPPCPAWIYIDAGVVQIAGQEGGPFMGKFPKEYRVPEGECTLPMNVYPLGKILLRLYYNTTEITDVFKDSSFPRDILIRKMLHPDPQHRYERFSQVWEDWQKIQLGMNIPSLESFAQIPFEPPAILPKSSEVALPSEPIPLSSPPPRSSSSNTPSVRASSSRPSIRRKKSSTLNSLVISGVLFLACAVLIVFLSKQNTQKNTEPKNLSSKDDSFQEELKKVEALVRRFPEAFEENMARYQNLRKYVKTESQAFLLKERYEDIRANFSVFQRDQKQQEIQDLMSKKLWKSALLQISDYESRYTADSFSETTKQQIQLSQKSTTEPPENTEVKTTETKEPETTETKEPETTELFNSTEETSSSEKKVDFEELRDEIWSLAGQGEFQKMQERLEHFLQNNKHPEAPFYLARAEGMLALRESAKQSFKKSPEKEYSLSIRGQKYKGTVSFEDGKFLLKRNQGGIFPFEITDLEVVELSDIGTFASAEDEVFFWLALNQADKALPRSKEIPASSLLKPILDDQLEEKNASNDRDRALQRWKKLQDLFKQKQFKSGKKLYDESMKTLEPIFPEIAEPLFDLYRQFLKQIDHPAKLLSGGIRFFSPEKADLEYLFKRPEELQDFTLLGKELLWSNGLQFQGEVFYAALSFKVPEIRVKLTPPVELRFGNFRARIETNLVGDLDTPSPLGPEKLLTFRFNSKDCEVFVDQLLIGNLDWDQSQGPISFFSETRSTLSFLGVRGTRANRQVETLHEDLQKWTARSYPINPGAQCKLYEDLDFYRQKAIATLPTLNVQWSKTLLPNTPEEGFTVRWSGLLYFPNAGERTFYCDSDEGVRFYVFEDRLLNTQGLPDPEGLDEKELKNLENKKKVKIQLRHGFIPIAVEQINKTRGGFLFICLEEASGKRLPLPLIFHKISSE